MRITQLGKFENKLVQIKKSWGAFSRCGRTIRFVVCGLILQVEGRGISAQSKIKKE